MPKFSKELYDLPLFNNETGTTDFGWAVRDVEFVIGCLRRQYEETGDERYLRALHEYTPPGQEFRDNKEFPWD